MNWEQVKKNEGTHVRLRPPARGLSIPDGDWFISEVNKRDRYAQLNFPPTGHTVRLNGDHLRNYVSDSTRGGGGKTFGFLLLEVELTFDNRGVNMEPLLREQQGTQWAIKDKLINNVYIEQAGLRQKYEHLRWVNEDRVAQLEGEGYQVVCEDDRISREKFRLVRRGQVLMSKS